MPYGSVVTFNLDMPKGTAKHPSPFSSGPYDFQHDFTGGPKTGDELLVSSASGRRVMGYIIQSVYLVWAPGFHRDRFKLRIMNVPVEQLENPTPIQRYGKDNPAPDVRTDYLKPKPRGATKLPYLETVDELSEHLADLLDIYRDRYCEKLEDTKSAEPQHVDNCNCRVGWVPNMAGRIRQAVEHEELLSQRKAKLA